VDFGVSGLHNGIDSEKSTAGSLLYLAPEIVDQSNTQADFALDIWSLGCILYLMLIGEHPFKGSSLS
jgi:serine/threonine protein kinase